MGNGNSLVNVTFDQLQPAIYYTGDTVSGRVHFNIPEPTKDIDEVFISLTGDVGYTTTRSVRMQNGQIERKTDEFDIRILGQRFLLGRPISNNHGGNGNSQRQSTTLQPGQYVYPFCIRLPDQLPPTIHPEDYPYVRYQLQVLIEKKWYHANDNHRYPIRIYPRVNLLSISNAQSAVKFGTKHKDVTIKGFLPRAGVVPGEQTSLSLSIQNPSRLAFKHIDICLIQRYEIEECRRRLELMRFPIPQIVNSHEPLIETTCPFTIPLGIAPSFSYTSKNTRTVVHVDLHYDLKLEFKAKGLFTDFDLQVPLIIGSNPEDHPPSYDRNTRSDMSCMPMKEIPPPSYESVQQQR